MWRVPFIHFVHPLIIVIVTAGKRGLPAAGPDGTESLPNLLLTSFLRKNLIVLLISDLTVFRLWSYCSLTKDHLINPDALLVLFSLHCEDGENAQPLSSIGLWFQAVATVLSTVVQDVLLLMLKLQIKDIFVNFWLVLTTSKGCLKVKT